MKVYQPAGARAEFYDRNPKTITLSYAVTGVAPHSNTQRATYTVPAGRKARVTTAKLTHLRTTAATTAGIVLAYAQLTPVGASAGILYLTQSLNGAVGAGDELNAQGQAVLLAGDQIALYTADVSTGGTVNYDLYLHLTEFDA